MGWVASEDGTANASLTRRVDLEMADRFIGNWRTLIMQELDDMRREMPYADALELRLICERKQP